MPPLRVTTTNAFAGRWLVPRLPLWRQAHPETTLEVIQTDVVMDLAAGNADVAIPLCCEALPGPELAASELLRDRFWPVAGAKLLAGGKAIRCPLI
jgi:LysR family glycine cleavage system transcriptional activator